MLDKALDLFLAHGFERTSIEAICAAAGMAKRTVYARYGDKTTLFKAALQRAIEEWIVPVEALQQAECEDLEECLLAVGRLLVANIMSPAGLRLLRLTNAVSGSMPEIGAYNVAQGTQPTIDYLAGLFRRRFEDAAMTEAASLHAGQAYLNIAVGGPALTAAWGVPFDMVEILIARRAILCVCSSMAFWPGRARIPTTPMPRTGDFGNSLPKPPACWTMSGNGWRERNVAGIEVVAEGLAFPEGPVVMADGSVIVVEIMAGRVTRCWNGRSEAICEPGGGPNGAAIGPDGALYVCNNGGMAHAGPSPGPGRIERVDLATGKVDRVYDSCDGTMLSAPNDLMFDCDGQMWFTDLGKLLGDVKEMGGLFCASPDGSRIARIKSRAFSYNGVGISPDMTTVYAADTFSARLYAFDRRIEEQEGRYVATGQGEVMFDSLAMAASGNVCVATIGYGVTTITPVGEVRTHAFDDPYVTNIAFGGPDMMDAWLTFSGRGALVRTRWDEPGMPLLYNA